MIYSTGPRPRPKRLDHVFIVRIITEVPVTLNMIKKKCGVSIFERECDSVWIFFLSSLSSDHFLHIV
jgi:hypothetical protein